MMNCEQARKTLGTADSPRVSDDQVESALGHAEGCPDCGRFLAEDRRIARLIHDSVPREPAPRALRERLDTVLDREAARTPSRSGAGGDRRWLVAALIVVGLGLTAAGHWLMNRAQPESPVGAFVENYLASVEELVAIETDDRGEVAALFAREMGMPMPPPLVADFTIQRSVVCLLDGHRGGVVEYMGEEGQLTYFVIPLGSDELVREGEVDVARMDGLGDFTPFEEVSLGIAVWWDGMHQHALIGALTPQRLRQLAPLFACPTRRL